MSERRSVQADEERLSHRNSAAGGSRQSSKTPQSDSHGGRSTRRRHSPSPSDRSNRPDQSIQSYSVRELAAESEPSIRSDYSGDYEGRRGRHKYGEDDRRRHHQPPSSSRYSHSDDQYSSGYESGQSASGSDSYSRSYTSRSSPTATHTSASYEPSERREPRFQGDVSAWGRKRMDPPRPECCGAAASESEYTLSSGLSPRGSEGDARAAFDPDEAKRALAYNAGLYGRANTMRREGTAPKTMGIADDLPNRFALEHLNALAGMASKVQAAIEHNRKVFAKRVRMEDKAVMKKAFDAWRAARYGSLAKQQLLRRAIARLQRGTLSRAFQAWKDKFHLVDKFLAMRRKVTATINRGRMKRAFLEWRHLCEDRWWKNQLAARDAQIHAMERKIEGFEKRPIVVIRRRKLYALMEAWFNASIERRRKRLRRLKAVMHWRNMSYIKAWNSWRAFVEVRVRRRNLLRKAAARMRNIGLVSAWNKWSEAVLAAREEAAKMNRALRHWTNATAARAWNQWWSWVLYRREYKIIINRWKNPMKARALRGWIAMVDWRKRMRVILQRAAIRLTKKQLVLAWEAWWRAIEERKMEETLTTKEQLIVSVKELREENERLRRDNERFVRLIDSGEWGRGRVAELVSAGEILKGERDALLKLIQSLRREYEAVQSAKSAQEEEMRALKERMLLGGAARNRMLVKGGSSFNALVRAMKQDLVEGGPGGQAAARDPNLLYQVDKLSLDQVTVFPDGELNVQAVASAPGAAAFARPISAGRGLRHPPASPGPVQPMRVPQGFGALGMGAGAGAGPSGASPGRGPPLAVGATGPGSGRPVSREEVVARLQSLSKEELDSFEAALRAQKAAAAGAGRPPGVASSSYR
ncbi:hypothetical protein PLESTB_000499600 [Pleodorina starrii]|uniref:Uncharacterized protein n=1 Tax=Pleodorina starrii TaxID=330485 RepID=A0A9W6BG41_9CHLO|nr:hypothetical protein PLESTM_000371000 [Pleodorina starrii]GLC51414.1 hypothetical protein PLESTB_000499600 [Pleodorina starrii]GLC63779.1 hypothetical protein PLESTF_000073100 [Pleodorina starrii]